MSVVYIICVLGSHDQGQDDYLLHLFHLAVDSIRHNAARASNFISATPGRLSARC